MLEDNTRPSVRKLKLKGKRIMIRCAQQIYQGVAKRRRNGGLWNGLVENKKHTEMLQGNLKQAVHEKSSNILQVVDVWQDYWPKTSARAIQASDARGALTFSTEQYYISRYFVEFKEEKELSSCGFQVYYTYVVCMPKYVLKSQQFPLIFTYFFT